MNSIKQMIHTLAATLCIVCLLGVCSFTLDKVLDRGNITQAYTRIRMGDFPPFGLEANNGTQPSSDNIGTNDPGKTTWENGDEILLKITDSKNVVTTSSLLYNGRSWVPSETLKPRFGSATIEAYYAPDYEWKSNELALKAGKSAVTDECFTFKTSVQQLSNGFTIIFGSNNYCCLRVATLTDVFKTYGAIENKTISLSAATIPSSYAMADPKWMIGKSCFYKWDSETPVNGDKPACGEGSSAQTDLFKSCTTAQEMVSYLEAGSYWDDGCEGDGKQTCTVTTSYGTESVSTGLWLKRKVFIESFGTDAFDGYYDGSDKMTNFSKLDADKINKIRTSGEYFFLPATGRYFGDYNDTGMDGYYWSGTPIYVNGAYCLFFDHNSVLVFGNARDNAYLPMVCE